MLKYTTSNSIKLLTFNEILIVLLPLFFISGSFLTDLICTYLGIFFFIYSLRKNDFHEYKNYIFFYFLLIYLYINFNSILSFNPVISFQTSIPYLRVILFIFAISFYLKNNNNLYKIFFYTFVFGLFLLFLDSTLQLFTGHNIFGQKKFFSSRISSFFGDKLIMGSYISRLLPVIIGISFLIDLKKRNFINLTIVTISGVLIILSGERLSFFYYLIFLLFFFLFFKKIIFQFLLIFSFLIGIIFYYNSSSIDRIIKFTYVQYKEANSIISYRHSLHFLTAYQMFLDKKFFGHGLKSFRNLCDNEKYTNIINKKINNDYDLLLEKNLNRAYVGEFKNGCNTHPHNIYLEFLSELGFVGFALYAFIFFYVFFLLLKFLIYFFRNKTIHDNYIASGFMLLSIFTSMFPFVPSGSYFNNWLLIISYLPIGFYLSLLKNKNV
jgi:hypothetical protein